MITPLPDIGANEPPVTVVHKIFTNDARAIAFTLSTVAASALTPGLSSEVGADGVGGGVCTIALAGGSFCVGREVTLGGIIFLVVVATFVFGVDVATWVNDAVGAGACTTTCALLPVKRN